MTMLYREFLDGTHAVDSSDSYEEYKRVERIYMESDSCTKEDAYRMAKVVTVEQLENERKKEKKNEAKWVKENPFEAACFVRAMAERKWFADWENGVEFVSPTGNKYELVSVWKVRPGLHYVNLKVNGKTVMFDEVDAFCVDTYELQSYRSKWYRMKKEQLEDLFGYIAWKE